ncbi:MAG: UDP-N-acetylmuramate--L-alanine ligase [Nitriliruptorales bacterium]|nr:UDP-N-acetylmuramate--L-alanine ligase [Nitriliruptorales bacterium]
MSALACVLLERGHPVSGSDLRGSRAVSALSALGADIAIGHDRAHVDGANLVAVSTAVPASNAERARALELGIPVVCRAELLAALMAESCAVLISGTHGKTTTTAMTTVALQAAGFDPSFAIGGTLHDAGTSAHHGTGEVFVAEADESDRSFLSYTTNCAVITNVELDHHDTYADEDEVGEAFAEFLERRVPGAPAIVGIEDPGVQALLAREKLTPRPPILGFGDHPDAELRISRTDLGVHGSSFHLDARGEDLGRFTLSLPGRHNVLNATAAVAVARWLGAPLDDVREGLATFHGTQRRFQRVGTVDGVTVVDDYAHHPTELVATISAARQTSPPGRIIAAFQPHRFSRTAALASQLGEALTGADLVVVTDVYGAGEQAVPGVTGELVADASRRAGAETHVVGAAGDLALFLAGMAREGDLILTLGAGDITEVGPVLLRLLDGRGA